MEQRVDDAEARGTRREARRHPPVARAEGQQEAEGETARERTTEQHALGHRFHDLEITQPPRQLDEADGAVDEERPEEHTSELQSQSNLVCRLLLEKKK